ncbi:solute carrier organic anion transporter family member 1A2-like isoform X2 [Atheta coriaria]|uniref:solute carrier organic anion transporter family member 1A2-like isoform X2 n=1 Tax=Dalotia coriaria TaxID=877792 RepID=UPI0031F3DE7B
MVHPTELFRSPSDVGAFSAPVGNIHAEPPDCGLNVLPWLATKLKLEKYNRNTVFVSLLSALVILHACAASYFVGTAKLWRFNYHISEVTAEWVVYLNPIFGGLFSLVLSHYGSVIHRPSYIGGLAMIHAVGGWILIVPELYHPQYASLNTSADQTLCKISTSKLIPLEEIFDDGKSYIALGILVAYQLVNGLAFVSIVSHGVAYIDDGCKKYTTPTFICFVVAAAQIGRFIGLNLTLIPVAFNRHLFFSFAWLVTLTLIFVFGFLISLFSKVPHRVLVRAGVNTLLHRQSTNNGRSQQQQNQEETKVLGFWESITSLFTSNLVLFNTLAATFMHVAILNFNAMREEFFRSRFVNFADDFDYHFSFYNVSALLFMCVIVLVMSQIFFRHRPSTKFYVVWLIVAYIAITGFFSSYAFLKCEDQTSLFKYNEVEDICNHECNCKIDVFDPVCLDGKTYYSGCFAGCAEKNSTGYFGCQCGKKSLKASAGSCNQDKCKVVAFFAEANSVITFGLIVSAYIVHVLIALRTVSHQQLKSSGIAFLLLGVQLLPYLPFKMIYELIKSTHCKKSYNHECFIFTKHFALTISLVTIGFMVLSIIMAVCMLRGAGQVNMYKRRGSQNLGTPSVRIPRRIEAVQEEDSEDEDEDEPTELNNLYPVQSGSSHAPAESNRTSHVPESSSVRSEEEEDLEEERLRKTEHHEESLRKSLHQVLASAARITPDGNVQEPILTSSEPTPRVTKRVLQKQNNVNSDHDFNSCDDLSLNGREDAPGYTDSEGMNDTDIDLELARINDEESPKCLQRKSTFSETNL